MNIHVNERIDEIHREFPNVNFEIVDELVYGSSKFEKNIIELRGIIETLNNINKTEKPIKIYAEDTVLLTNSQLRDIRQDKNNIYLFLKGFVLEKESFTTKRQDHYQFIRASSEDFFDSKMGDFHNGYWAIGIMFPNIISICVEFDDPSTKQYDFMRVVEDAFSEVSKTQNDRNNVVLNKTKQAIIEKCNKDIENKSETLKSISNRIEDLNEDLIALFKEKSQVEKELAYMTANKEKRISNLLNLATSCNKIHGVESVEMLDGLEKIIIRTGPIHIKSMGYTFYIGKFEVTVEMSSSKLHFVNTEPENRRRSHWGNNCMHPHISYDGRACLGNIAESVMIATKNADIKSICAIVLNYLTSVNPDDSAGKHLTSWDVVNDDGVIIDFPKELKDCKHCGKKVTETTKDNFSFCHDCDEHFCSDHNTFVTVLEDGVAIPAHLCFNCFSEYTKCKKCDNYAKDIVTCAVCGLKHCKACAHPIIYNGEYAYICESCENGIKNSNDGTFIGVSLKVVECQDCGRTFLLEDIDAHAGDTYTCDECQRYKCHFCHNSITGRAVQVPGVGSLCVECWKKTDVCDICQQIKLKEDLVYNDNNNTKICKNGCITEE